MLHVQFFQSELLESSDDMAQEEDVRRAPKSFGDPSHDLAASDSGPDFLPVDIAQDAR
jgi:hypothetical protein